MGEIAGVPSEAADRQLPGTDISCNGNNIHSSIPHASFVKRGVLSGVHALRVIVRHTVSLATKLVVWIVRRFQRWWCGEKMTAVNKNSIASAVAAAQSDIYNASIHTTKF
ncbi:unnamed protein product [Cuscuta campestris]|uniref:Uncharacterized protein n=1 Tax=Cuscuta campestris TaxID=132261 RepID=A0A484LIX2_9ASTE|nr:unnamed protein product [Cuscuta campestris]